MNIYPSRPRRHDERKEKCDKNVTTVVTPPRRRRQITEKRHRIEEYFKEYPHSTAKSCCRSLALAYKEFGAVARKIKQRTKEFFENIQNPQTVTRAGQVPKVLVLPANHHVEFHGHVPSEFIGFLKSVKTTQPGSNAWYRSANLNGQWCVRSGDVAIYVFPRSETCRVRMKHPMDFVALRDAVEQAFVLLFPKKAPWRLHPLVVEFSGKLLQEVSSQHRNFYTGPLTPFRVDYYKRSHGLTIYNDRSHADYLEVLEESPNWMKAFIREFLEWTQRQPNPDKIAKTVESAIERMEQSNLKVETELKELIMIMHQLLNTAREPSNSPDRRYFN